MDPKSVLLGLREKSVGLSKAQTRIPWREIINDIMVLTGSYPIETVCGRYGGGIRLMDGYYLNPKRLTADETNLLKRLATTLYGEDLILMNGIITRLAPY